MKYLQNGSSCGKIASGGCKTESDFDILLYNSPGFYFFFPQILMAGNTLVAFFWREVMLQAVSTEAWEYLAVCVPIVVIGAPCGSMLGSHFHRQVDPPPGLVPFPSFSCFSI